jgi:acetolactate synthase-1/2/3 large subunit
MNCSQVMAKYIKAAGIKHVFGYPGDPNVEFIEAARKEGMQFVLGRREGQQAGKPGYGPVEEWARNH